MARKKMVYDMKIVVTYVFKEEPQTEMVDVLTHQDTSMRRLLSAVRQIMEEELSTVYGIPACLGGKDERLVEAVYFTIFADRRVENGK